MAKKGLLSRFAVRAVAVNTLRIMNIIINVPLWQLTGGP